MKILFNEVEEFLREMVYLREMKMIERKIVRMVISSRPAQTGGNTVQIVAAFKTTDRDVVEFASPYIHVLAEMTKQEQTYFDATRETIVKAASDLGLELRSGRFVLADH